MKSFIEDPLGADRSIIMRHVPSFLGTKPTGEHCKFSKGGEAKGPATQPKRTSVKIVLNDLRVLVNRQKVFN